MRVLHVIGQLNYGGAELLLIEIANRMARESVDVTIVVLGYCEPELRRRVEEAGVRVVRLNAGTADAARNRIARSPMTLLRLRRAIRSGKHDIVHAHLFPAMYWVALCSLGMRDDACWIFSEHSTHNSRRERAWIRPLERWVYRRYDAIICVAREVQDSLAKWVPDARNVCTISNGVDIERFASVTPLSRDELGLATDDIMVFMAGYFRIEKNQAGLVRSLAFLPVRYKLVLAGDGAELPNVRRIAQETGVAERVRFLGAVGNVDALMRTADVYVLPSFFEGLPLSPIEAAAAGLPVVYSDVGGLRSLLDDTGVPVRPDDPQSIARGIVAATAPDTRGDLERKSRALATRFDIRETIKSYRARYETLLSRKEESC